MPDHSPEMISDSKVFNLDKDDLSNLMDPKLYIGRSSEQVGEFIDSEVDPLLKDEENCAGIFVELNV